jgi:hypothetical protein
VGFNNVEKLEKVRQEGIFDNKRRDEEQLREAPRTRRRGVIIMVMFEKKVVSASSSEMLMAGWLAEEAGQRSDDCRTEQES